MFENPVKLNCVKKESNMENIKEIDLELKKNAIEKYVNIQRIKRYGQDEIVYQEKIVKAELKMLGVATDDLEY